jgi:hypothetical protein
MQDDLNTLIDELLARELRPNTREDLGTFREELAAGKLSADDAKYIRALHKRVVEGGAPKRKAEPADDTEPGEAETLKASLADAQKREQALIAERDQLQKTVAELRQEIEALKREAAKS